MAAHPAGAGILHADLDAFYASVEQRDDPRLRGRPVIVGAGVVLSSSYEARACGVRTAMPNRMARSLCPQAVVVPPRMDAYAAASKAVFAVFADTSPLVEPLSIDEAFLDVRGLWQIRGTPEVIARSLRMAVRSEVGLAITVGVARTKFLAKVASAVAKPDGLLVVPAGGELAFLHPLPVRRLWGVGAVTAEKLYSHGITTVGDVAALSERSLVAMLGGAAGRHIHALAHNRDPRPVVVGRRRRSIGSQSALGHRTRTAEELEVRVLGLAERVCRRLRSAGRLCRTVVLRVRFDDLSRITRSHTLPGPTSDTADLVLALRNLLTETMPLIHAQGITLIGITLANLCDSTAVQLELPFQQRRALDDGLADRGVNGTGGRGLDSVVDRVRDRYGTASITRGVLLGSDPGMTVPMLPD